jgi:hypothetical protein
MRTGKHNLHFLVGVELLPHAFVNIPEEKMYIGVFFIFIFIVYFIFYFIIIATSCIRGYNSNSHIYVGDDNKVSTGFGIPAHTPVCLEVNTHMRTLDYFINDKYIKNRVVNVPKDVYFEV